METESQFFISLLSKWKEAYTQAVHSYVGVKTNKGVHLYYGRLSFETNATAVNEMPFRFETEHFVAGRFAKSVDEQDILPAIERATKSGEMDGLESVIALAKEINSVNICVHLNDYDFPFRPKLFVRGASFHGIQNTDGFPRRPERELQAADTPFESLEDLLTRCGLSSKQVGDTTTLELVVGPPGSIDRSSEITEANATIKCRLTAKLNRSKVKLGWRILCKDKKIVRGSALGDAFRWQEDGEVANGIMTIPTGGAPSMRIYLSYDGIVIDEHFLMDQAQRLNLQHTVHEIFDAEYDNLRESMIGPKNDKGNTFETAVSALLTLLGFSVTHYGAIKRLQDGPDIIAITPSGCIGIIECTLGFLDHKGKISKLVRRRQLIQEGLTRAGSDASQCLAVMFTPLSRGEVEADLTKAGANKLAVVCREQIEQFLNRVSFSDDADDLFSELKTLIPITPSDAHPFSR